MEIILRFCLASIIFLTACQQNNNTNGPDIVGKWKLVSQESNGLSPTRKIPLPGYDEIYEFKKDGSFRLFRSDGWEETGTYTRKEIDNQIQIEATFSNNAIGFSCNAGKTLLKPDHNMLLVSSAACDGPNLYYSKISGEE